MWTGGLGEVFAPVGVGRWVEVWDDGGVRGSGGGDGGGGVLCFLRSPFSLLLLSGVCVVQNYHWTPCRMTPGTSFMYGYEPMSNQGTIFEYTTRMAAAAVGCLFFPCVDSCISLRCTGGHVPYPYSSTVPCTPATSRVIVSH